MSHAGYLRANWIGEDSDFVSYVQGLIARGKIARGLSREAGAEHVASWLETAPMPGEEDRAIAVYVAWLTLAPHAVDSKRFITLRDAGLTDHTIHDVVMVAACFAFMNTLADGTGVTLTSGAHGLAVELFGQEGLEAHLAWGDGG